MSRRGTGTRRNQTQRAPGKAGGGKVRCQEPEAAERRGSHGGDGRCRTCWEPLTCGQDGGRRVGLGLGGLWPRRRVRSGGSCPGRVVGC